MEFETRAPRDIMRVKVEMVVHVDADAWREEYGVNRSDVRRDVKAYCENAVRNTYAAQSELFVVQGLG